MLRQRPSLSRIADRRTIATTLGLCLAIGIFPLLLGLLLSFCSFDSNGAFHLASLDGYRALIGGGRLGEFRKILSRSAVVTIITMAIAVPTAFALARMRRKRLRTALLVSLVAPWLVSDMLRAFGWQLLLSPDGPVIRVLGLFIGMGQTPNLRYRFGAVVLGLVTSMLPVGVLSVLAAIPDQDRNEWLAASELGRARHVFGLMVFGRARLGIVLGIFSTFILSTFSSAEARFLDGPTQTSVQTVAASLANDGVPSLLALGSGLIGFVLLLCVVGMVAYYAIRRPFRLRTVGPDAPLCLRLPAKRRTSVISKVSGELFDTVARMTPPLAVWLSVSLCISPLAAVAAEAFRQVGPHGMYWTLSNFGLMLESSELIEALLNSFAVAFAVGCIAAVIGFILSLVVWDRPLQRWVAILLLASVLLPGESYAIALLQTLKVFGRIDGGWALVILAHALWAVPFATGTLVLANRRLGENALQAAMEYGNGPLEVVVRFVGRINITRIMGAAMLAGTLSLNEYVRSSYLGASLITVSNEVHGRLTSGLLPENRGVFAAEFLIVGLSLIALVTTIALLGRTKVRRSTASTATRTQRGGNSLIPHVKEACG